MTYLIICFPEVQSKILYKRFFTNLKNGMTPSTPNDIPEKEDFLKNGKYKKSPVTILQNEKCTVED